MRDILDELKSLWLPRDPKTDVATSPPVVLVGGARATLQDLEVTHAPKFEFREIEADYRPLVKVPGDTITITLKFKLVDELVS